MRKYSIYILVLISFIFIQCTSEDLKHDNSVIETEKYPSTELQKWVNNNYTKPYNIKVAYQWKQESTYDKSVLYPPQEDKAKVYLKALQYLWIDLYKEVAGEAFLKNLAPTEIKLFGNANIDGFGVERMKISQRSPLPLTLFRVDEFQTDKESIRRLVRNIQNNTVRLMILRKPFNKEEFAKLNTYKYRLDYGKGVDIYKTTYTMYNGFYSIPAARYNVEEDFAETASVLISTPRQEINSIIEAASTPSDDYVKEIKRAENAKKTLEGKRDFVTNYFRDEYGIDIDVLSIKNLIRMQNYLKNTP